MSSPPPVSSYRLSRRHALRLLGPAVCATGLVVLVYAVARALSAPAWLQIGLLVKSGLWVLLASSAALLVVRPVELVRLDQVGFRVRWPHRRSGSWRDIDDVAGGFAAGQRVAVLRHQDGRTTLLPLSLLDASAADVEADLHRRLDTAYGYRRLDRPDIRAFRRRG